jgi:quercetin dioxygenase-like cupin family protein
MPLQWFEADNFGCIIGEYSMISVFPFHSIPPDNDYEPPIDLRWGITDEMCGARDFCANRVYIPPRSNNQHHYHLGCEALIYFTHGRWRVFRGIEREAVTVEPGDCVHIPVGEPHSYQILDENSPGKELAFYGMIPHRRWAETTFIDDHWVEEGKTVRADRDATEQVIDAAAWQPSFSQGKITHLKAADVQADCKTIAPLAVRWLASKAICEARALVSGLATLAPRQGTRRLQNRGAEMMLFLFKGALEVRDWRGQPHYVSPETFVYVPRGVAWSIANPDIWDEAEFFLSYGGINSFDAADLVQSAP